MHRHDVLIANGFDRFLLLIAAAEAERRDRLDCCIAGFYPTAKTCRQLSSLGLLKQPRFARLLDRKTDLSDERLVTASLWEAFGHLGGRLLGDRAIGAARRGFARKAETVVRRSGARLYHYRSGYGHSSAVAAKQRGMATLCDHSIAHPAVLAHLVDNQGRLPPVGERGPVNSLWAEILDDLRHADRVLANSDFVKETFVHQGWDPDRVEVIYQGLDEGFFDLLPERKREAPKPQQEMNTPLRLAFAGAFEQRKGANHLVQAMSMLDDLPWSLELIGPLDDTVKRRHEAFLADPRVTVVGRVDRRELARRLSTADVFLFPTLAEGSARVIFEALAAGCYVITTPNGGSIVEDRVHGALVKPDDPKTTIEALRLAHADLGKVRSIGDRNADLIREHYRQSDYGDALMAVYDRLLSRDRPASERKAA